MSRSARLALVEPEDILSLWPQVAPMIDRAMRCGDLGKSSEVKSMVINGEALLWVILDPGISAAIVTQVSIVESGKCCHIVACGGERVLKALPLLAHIEDYARHEGCKKMRLLGRKGWARALPDYKQTRVVLDKEL